MSPNKLHLECSLDKELYYHGETISVNVHIQASHIIISPTILKQNYAGEGIWQILFWCTESFVHPKIKDGACFYMEMSLQLPAACQFKLIITIAKRIACISGFLHKCQSVHLKKISCMG